MQKTLLEYELIDGSAGTVRVLACDKVGMEKTVRINDWPLEDGPRTATLLLFYALRRNWLIESDNYDSFISEELADYALAAPPEDEDEEDPKVP